MDLVHRCRTWCAVFRNVIQHINSPKTVSGFSFRPTNFYTSQPLPTKFAVTFQPILCTMKIASCLALTLFLSAAEAFGPASPVNGNAFGLSSKASHGMTMRVGKVDLSRKQRFNDVLATTGALSSKEAVQEQLLSSDVNSLIQKSSYKVRRAMIRKVNLQASRQGVDVPLGFGVP